MRRNGDMNSGVGAESRKISIVLPEKRAEVGVHKVIGGDDIETGFGHFFSGEGAWQCAGLRAGFETGEMIVEAKDRAFSGIARVGADAFKDTDSVVKGVSEDADLGFVARNEFSIEPDFFHKGTRLKTRAAFYRL